MYLPPPLSSADLLPLLFPFCAVPKAFLARFRFLCSQLSAQREKGKNKRVGGVGGMVAGRKPSRSRPLALARPEERGEGTD